VVNRISVADPDDRNAFDLVAQLEARLGRARTAPYRLSYRIDTGVSPLAITPENAITRYNITGSVSFKVATPAGVELTSGRVQGFAAYSATGTPVSTAAARTDAYRRLMTMLADQIVTRLVASSAGWASP
jgi:LPS-assembly lipoprotein